MTPSREFMDIRGVTLAAYDAAEARMAVLRGGAARIESQLADLDRSRRERSAQLHAEDAALRAGADLRWDQWVSGRQRDLMSELARLRARIENERQQLSIAFGRKTVAQNLCDEAVVHARITRARRAERGG